MLTITELIDNLVDTELANLSIKDKDGDIKPNRLKQIIANLNLGMIDLYTRFKLKTIEVIHKAQTDQKQFSPIKDRAWEVIEVLQVFDNDEPVLQEGYKTYHKTNVKNGSDIVLDYTPYTGNKIKIISQVSHPKITVSDYCNQAECHLPTPYIAALYYFVASRLYTSINNQLDGDLNESTRYSQKYFDEINHLTSAGITVDEMNTTNWFSDRGFR